MNQISDTLQRIEGGYLHYCCACDEMHMLPDDETKYNPDELKKFATWVNNYFVG